MKRINICCNGFKFSFIFSSMILLLFFFSACKNEDLIKEEQKNKVVRRSIIVEDEREVLATEPSSSENPESGLEVEAESEKVLEKTKQSEEIVSALKEEENSHNIVIVDKNTGPFSGNLKEELAAKEVGKDEPLLEKSLVKKADGKEPLPEKSIVKEVQAEKFPLKVEIKDGKEKDLSKSEEDRYKAEEVKFSLADEEDLLAAKLLEIKDKREVYNPLGRINPFQPLVQETSKLSRKTSSKGLERRIPQTPLERLDLSQLKLVGIVRSPMGAQAMVEESVSGRGYVVTMGTYMGLNSGKVTSIEGASIVVTEIVEDLSGVFVEEKRELKLQKPSGE